MNSGLAAAVGAGAAETVAVDGELVVDDALMAAGDVLTAEVGGMDTDAADAGTVAMSTGIAVTGVEADGTEQQEVRPIYPALQLQLCSK